MKTNITKIGAALLAVGICIWSPCARAQTSTTVTTSKGAFTEYVPSSETVVVRNETSTTPLRYTVTKTTTIVDESGTPMTIERIPPGSPLSIEYTGSGERLVASRIVVQRPTTTVTAPATGGPATTQQQTTTTTSETRPLSHEEKEALEHQHKAEKKAEKEEIERQQKALEKAKDKVEEEKD